MANATDKIMTMSDAISTFVRDGSSVALEGFTHLIPTAAGHEIALVGGSVRDDAASVGKLVELRRLYEPFLVGLGIYFRLPLPAVWPTGDGPDNWQTSAWLRQAGPLASLGIDPKDEHF